MKSKVMILGMAVLELVLGISLGISQAQAEEKLNFVIFLTDDQRWDTVGDSGVNAEIKQRYGRPIMPHIEEKLVKNGVLFSNAFVTTPLCCPDRASLLSGGFYAQHTGVLWNELPNGGVRKFKDNDTIATQLQERGYQTALIGKYLNEYPKIAPYIPSGWTKFLATSGGLIAPADKKTPRDTKKSAKKSNRMEWFNPCAVRGSSGSSSSEGKVECFLDYYVTDLQRDEALGFLDSVGDAPFFLYFSTHAPHGPATPAKGDEELFSEYKYRGRAYGETDLSDKPEWVSQEAKRYQPNKEDGFHLQQLRSLQAVDKAIGEIIDKIEKMGKLDQTVFIFSSDNGFLWGEHRLRAKALAYEESIRVPLVVVIPGEDFKKGQVNGVNLITANLDIGTTIFELSGIEKKTDGRSLVPLLKGSFFPWREDFLIETYGGRSDKHNWAGLRTSRYKYIEYANEKQEKELYDLQKDIDPFEAESKHNNADYQEVIKLLSEQLAPQKGLTMTVYQAPRVEVGKAYEFQLRAWGGVEPYTWSITEGPEGEKSELPEGLSLNSSTGLISGSLKRVEKHKVWIKVEDSQIVQPANGPQSFVRDFVFSPPLLSHGPLVGAVTSDSAKVWVRTDSQAKVEVEYAPDSDFDNDPLLSKSLTTSAANDYTTTITINNLSPDTTYYYRILIDGMAADFPAPNQTPARFKTFSENASVVKVGILTDLTTATKTVPAPAMAALSHDEPDFVLVLGDWDHRNVFNLEEMRAMHRQTRQGTPSGNTFRDHILYKFPVAHVWDDHDYAGNNSDKTFENKRQAIQAYDEYWPSYQRPNPEAGIWHSFKYGNLVEVFMLDLRSQRDLNSYKDPRYVPGKEPNNPSRDLIRNDPCRSMLDGDVCPEGKSQGQKQWLKDSLKNSLAPWKLIVSTVPWNPTTFKDDAWWDFKAEQEELLKFIKESNISGVMLVSGDIHTGGAIDDGRNTGLPEMNVPTVNLEQKTHETCSLTNPHQRLGCGAWSEGYVAEGVGYGLITLSGQSALLEAKDDNAQTRFKLELGELEPPDNQRPAISITTPGNGDIIKGGILIHAEATDNVGIERVEFSIAGKTTVDNSLPYEMDWNSRNVEDGPYTLFAKAFDAAGNSAEESIELRVENELPLKADFTASPLSGEAPLTVRFTDQSTGKIDSWEWTFWDLSAPVGSTEQNPIYTFTQAGTYNVSLTVSNQSGEHHGEFKENFILVKEKVIIDQPPIADAGQDQVVESGTLVHLDGSKSSDPDGDEIGYQWEQVSGPLVQLEGKSAAIASFTTPQWADEAKLSFKLTVTARDKSAEDTTTVVVKPKPQPPAPLAQFTAASLSGEAPLTVQFTDQSTGQISSWLWDFGDGQTSSEQNPKHTYTLSGTLSGKYTVSLSVSGPQGSDKETKEGYIRVYPSHPHPKPDRHPKARAGEDQRLRSQDLVKLDGAKSADPDGDPLTYQWRQLAGPEVVLSGNDQAIATFSAPEVKKEAELKFELRVSAKDKTDKDQTTVLVRPALPQEIPFHVTITGKTKCQIELRLSATSPSPLFASLSYKIKNSEGRIVKRGNLMRDFRDRQGHVHYETIDDLYLPIAPYAAYLEIEGKVISTTNFGAYNTPADELSLEIPVLRPVLGEKNSFALKLRAFSTQQPNACLMYKLINTDKAKTVKKGRLSFIPRINKEKAFYAISHRKHLLELPNGNYQLIIESSYGGRLEKEIKLGGGVIIKALINRDF